MDTVTICYWVAQILGTLLALMYTFMAGLGKLLPFHPMYKELEPGFAKLNGPFFGLPGALLRTIIGLACVSAGAGVLAAFWYPLEGHLKELSQVLVLCAFVGLITISLGAAWAHVVIDGNPGPMTMMLPCHCIVLYCRLKVTPLSSFDDKSLASYPVFETFPPATLFERFVLVCVVALVGAVISRMMCGEKTDVLKATKAEMEAAKE